MFQAWLENENAARSVLLEIEVLTPAGQIDTLFIASHEFFSPYMAGGIKKVRISNDQDWGIDGDLDIINTVFIDKVISENLIVTDRPLRLYFGDPSWAKSDFILFRLICKKLSIQSTNKARLQFTGLDAGLDREINSATLITDDGSDETIPFLLGRPFNVSPLEINPTQYRLTDSDLTIEAIRSGGLDIDPARITQEYGGFRVDPPPTKDITVDAITVNADVKFNLQTLFNDVGIQHDIGDITADIGIYSDRILTYREAIKRLLNSAGLRADFWYSGIARLYQPTKPTLDNALNINAHQIKQDSLKLVEITDPIKAVVIHYRHNYSQQGKSSLFDSVVFDYEKEFLKVKEINETVATIYNQAKTIDIETDLTQSASAKNEAKRRLNYHSRPCKIWELTLFGNPLNLQLGMSLIVEYPGFGFENGRLAVLESFSDWQPLNSILRLRVRTWD